MEISKTTVPRFLLWCLYCQWPLHHHHTAGVMTVMHLHAYLPYLVPVQVVTLKVGVMLGMPLQIFRLCYLVLPQTAQI